MDGYHEALAWHREITDAVRTGRVINLIKAEGITVANAIKLCESDLKDGWHACNNITLMMLSKSAVTLKGM